MAVAGVVARVEIGVVMSNKHIKIVIKPQVQKSTKKTIVHVHVHVLVVWLYLLIIQLLYH